MSKTSSAVKARYNAKAYDRLAVTIPKGQKEAVEAFAQSMGESVNGLINRLLYEAMNMPLEAWKSKQEEQKE